MSNTIEVLVQCKKCKDIFGADLESYRNKRYLSCGLSIYKENNAYFHKCGGRIVIILNSPLLEQPWVSWDPVGGV